MKLEIRFRLDFHVLVCQVRNMIVMWGSGQRLTSSSMVIHSSTQKIESQVVIIIVWSLKKELTSKGKMLELDTIDTVCVLILSAKILKLLSQPWEILNLFLMVFNIWEEVKATTKKDSVLSFLNILLLHPLVHSTMSYWEVRLWLRILLLSKRQVATRTWRDITRYISWITSNLSTQRISKRGSVLRSDPRLVL